MRFALKTGREELLEINLKYPRSFGLDGITGLLKSVGTIVSIIGSIVCLTIFVYKASDDSSDALAASTKNYGEIREIRTDKSRLSSDVRSIKEHQAVMVDDVVEVKEDVKTVKEDIKKMRSYLMKMYDK